MIRNVREVEIDQVVYKVKELLVEEIVSLMEEDFSEEGIFLKMLPPFGLKGLQYMTGASRITLIGLTPSQLTILHKECVAVNKCFFDVIENMT